MHEQAIIDAIRANLPLAETGCRVVNISLTCSEAALCERLARDVSAGKRTDDVIARSVARLPLYPTLDSTLIDTTALTSEEAAERILSISPLLDNGA